MASLYGFLARNWHIQHPTAVPKKDHALKIGILGAAKIG